MKARLIGRTGGAAGVEHPVSDLLTLGSGAVNGLRIESRTLSRQHAQIVKSGDTYYLEDLGSRNGTFLNGQRVTRFPIRNLDVVSLGPDIDLIFIESGAPVVAPRRSEPARAAAENPNPETIAFAYEDPPEGRPLNVPRAAPRPAPPPSQTAEADGHTVAAPREPAIAPLITPPPGRVPEPSTLSAPREPAGGLPDALAARARAARRVGDMTTPLPNVPSPPPAPAAPARPRTPVSSGTGPLSGVVLDGPSLVRLNLGSFDIGRHPDADVVVNSPDVGRRHARLHVRVDRVELEDLEAANGTFVDDRAITGVATVPDGGRIRFATVEFAIMYVRNQVQRG